MHAMVLMPYSLCVSPSPHAPPALQCNRATMVEMSIETTVVIKAAYMPKKGLHIGDADIRELDGVRFIRLRKSAWSTNRILVGGRGSHKDRPLQPTNVIESIIEMREVVRPELDEDSKDAVAIDLGLDAPAKKKRRRQDKKTAKSIVVTVGGREEDPLKMEPMRVALDPALKAPLFVELTVQNLTCIHYACIAQINAAVELAPGPARESVTGAMGVSRIFTGRKKGMYRFRCKVKGGRIDKLFKAGCDQRAAELAADLREGGCSSDGGGEGVAEGGAESDGDGEIVDDTI